MRLASRLVDPYPDPPEFTSFSQGCEALDIPERAVINHQGYQRCKKEIVYIYLILKSDFKSKR